MIQKTSSIAAQAGGGTAFASGAGYVLGFTPAEWSVFGVIAGVVIGIAGLCVNSYFQWKRLEMDRSKQ